MSFRPFGIAGILVTISACLSPATGAQPGRPEPQALKDSRENPGSPEARARYFQASSEVARSFYQKLKFARKGVPESQIEHFDYEIRRSSLEWFKAQIRAT